jgi:hypothetical protein
VVPAREAASGYAGYFLSFQFSVLSGQEETKTSTRDLQSSHHSTTF